MPRLKAPQRRQQLVEVATRLFARTGYDATTTAAIADAAGVTEPILYRHFKSKQDLFVAIVRHMSEQTMQQWRELIAGVNDPADQIRRISEAIPDHMKRLTDAYHVLHGALTSSRDRKVVAVLKEHYDQIETFFSKVISDGQKSGVFSADLDPRAAAWGLITAGIGYGMIALNLGMIEKRMVDQMIEGLVRGLSH